MRPALIDNMSWAMAEVYGAVTDRILVNLARHFPYIKDAGEVRGAFEYQARMLGQMGQINRETADIIMQSLDGADQALRGALETAILDALKTEEPKLRKAAEKGLLRGGGLLPPEMSANQMQAFQAYYRQSADKLNLVNTVMLESTEAAYRATVTDAAARIGRTQSILNVGAGEVVTGVSSWNQAMHDAVKKMVTNGLTGFIDHGGHRWSPEAYVAMDIRTTMFNTARSAVWERADSYGADFYQVSSHNGARPLCYPWQGKVISRSGFSGMTEDLDGNKVRVYPEIETTKGQAAGLFGINCKHYPMTFIPGFSTLKGDPQDPEENEKSYAESQEQRALERKLREEKRGLEVMKAQGASEEEIKAQRSKVRQASADIDEFCDKTGRARRRNREYAPIDAKFPPKDSYNPGEFPTEQRDKMRDWFKNGGDNPPPSPTNIHLGDDNIPPKGQAQIPTEKAAKQNPKTLQMFDEATEWANDNFKYEMENLRESWSTVQSQIEAFDQFEKEIPTYEKALKSAIDREEFSARTTPRAVQQILEDGRLKSQIETGASGGYLDVEKRKRTTSNLFAGGEPIELAQQEYEIYGYLGNAPRAKMYGDSRIVFKKNNLIDRTTVTVGDSLELLSTGADPMPSLATNPKITSGGIKVFSDSVPNAPQRLNDTRRDFESIKEKGYLDDGNYVELQFHGGVTVDDIEYIEVAKSANNAKEIANLAKEKGVKIRWK